MDVDSSTASIPWPRETELVYTKGRSIELLKQPKPIKDFLHRVIHHYQGQIYFENTYPNVDEQVELIRIALKNAAKSLHLREVMWRLECDPKYCQVLGKVVSPALPPHSRCSFCYRIQASDRISVWRLPLKNYASGHISHSYNLADRGPERVAKLLTGESYIYPGDVMVVCVLNFLLYLC